MSDRNLTTEELSAICQMAREVGSEVEREQLLRDVKCCLVNDERVADRSVLVFHIEGYDRPAGHGMHTYLDKEHYEVEGSLLDSDGAAVSVYLFADKNGRVYEFELDKHSQERLKNPDWTTFRIR